MSHVSCVIVLLIVVELVQTVSSVSNIWLRKIGYKSYNVCMNVSIVITYRRVWHISF